MSDVGRARGMLGWLRRRACTSAASLLAVGLAVSCGLSPVDDLPSAVDGLTVDGGSDSPSLDLVAGAGGTSSEATGGAPNCAAAPQTECRGPMLWQMGITSSCAYENVLLDACEGGCVDEPNDGAAHCVGWGGAGGVGGGGIGGADSADDGEVP